MQPAHGALQQEATPFFALAACRKVGGRASSNCAERQTVQRLGQACMPKGGGQLLRELRGVRLGNLGEEPALR
eukprot:6383248-Lingulodinium_polyedra.AAC.1